MGSRRLAIGVVMRPDFEHQQVTTKPNCRTWYGMLLMMLELYEFVNDYILLYTDSL